MSVYVVEINGRAVAAIGAMDRLDAEATVDQEFFRSDLMVLETDGAPVWDGVSDLFIRDSFPEEADRLEKAAGRDDSDPNSYVLFLVPVNDPTDDEDEEEFQEWLAEQANQPGRTA